jgi:hypothetical protein
MFGDWLAIDGIEDPGHLLWLARFFLLDNPVPHLVPPKRGIGRCVDGAISCDYSTSGREGIWIVDKPVGSCKLIRVYHCYGLLWSQLNISLFQVGKVVFQIHSIGMSSRLARQL